MYYLLLATCYFLLVSLGLAEGTPEQVIHHDRSDQREDVDESEVGELELAVSSEW